MTLPSVSVVLPCYRQAHFLGEALESVLAQEHPACQVIVVDDGSPDNVEAVIRQYPGVIYLRQENAGLASARNRGLAECSGEFVVFLDADDRLLPNALTEGARALSERPRCGFVWGFNRPIDAVGRVIPADPRIFSGGARYVDLLHENVVGPPLAVMFRRSVLDAVGGFCPDIKFSEDYEVYLRITRDYESYCHECLISEYRLHGANMSSDLGGMLSGVLATLEKQKPLAQGDPELRRALRRGRQLAWENYDGARRMEYLSVHRRAGRYLHASLCAGALLLLYPKMFLPIVLRRVKRLAPTLRPSRQGSAAAPE